MSRVERKLTLYRDDSTSQIVYDRVKTWFWTAGNTVLVISRYDDETGGEQDAGRSTPNLFDLLDMEEQAEAAE